MIASRQAVETLKEVIKSFEDKSKINLYHAKTRKHKDLKAQTFERIGKEYEAKAKDLKEILNQIE